MNEKCKANFNGYVQVTGICNVSMHSLFIVITTGEVFKIFMDIPTYQCQRMPLDITSCRCSPQGGLYIGLNAWKKWQKVP